MNQQVNTCLRRIPAFDILKVFAIYMVLWGHCIQYFLSTEHSHDAVYRVIYSFHMPLFMTTAGFFSIRSFNLTPKALFTKKFRELIYPVLFWGIIFFIVHAFINIHQGNKVYYIYDIVAIYTKNLWFLKCLFICYLAGYFCFRSQINVPIILATLILSQFITSHNICIMYPCFLFGILLRRKPNLIENKYFTITSFSLFSIMLFWWDASFWPSKGVWFAPNMLETFKTGDISYVYQYLQKGIYRIIIGLAGGAAFISSFTMLFTKKDSPLIKVLAVGGQYTLGIYITQFFVLECCLGSFVKLNEMNYFLFHFIITPIISLLLLIILSTLVMYTYKNRYVSMIMWGKNV